MPERITELVSYSSVVFGDCSIEVPIYCYTGSQIDGFIIAKITISIQFIKSLSYQYKFSALTKFTAVFFILKRKSFPSSDIITVVRENITYYALKPLVEAFFPLNKASDMEIFSNFALVNYILLIGIWQLRVS